MRAHRVRVLLMGGQACVFYGAAEFSRDINFVLLANAANLTRLRGALDDLRAQPIAVPTLDLRSLRRGHAVHFRCMHPDAHRLRIDFMSRMRGVDTFESLWRRRTVIALGEEERCHLVSLPDLVKAKKTQRDKDWPMIRRLVEAHYFRHRANRTPARVRFWLLELRTAELLHEVACAHPRTAARIGKSRDAVRFAKAGDLAGAEAALRAEELGEREADRAHWKPLIAELAAMRRGRGLGRAAR
jgi:hypothetical protein